MEKNNKIAVVAYLTIIGAVIAIFMNSEENKSDYNSFHIRQALGIFISFFLLGYFVGNIDSRSIPVTIPVLLRVNNLLIEIPFSYSILPSSFLGMKK